MTPIICAIAGMDEGRVIGLNNKLPWHIPEDMRYFKEKTAGHTVLMGRKTYESLPVKFRPLPGRLNVVLTRSWLVSPHPQVKLIDDLPKYLNSVKSGQEQLNSDRLWIIGGQQVYTESLTFWDELYLTKVHSKNEGDAFFPEFEKYFDCVSKQPSNACTFEVYRRH